MVVSGTTSTNTTTSTTSTSGSSTQSPTFVPGGSLDKNSFLTLLATQLQYQDPLQPQDNTQFVSQLAQFSALEQTTNVATQETQVVSGITQLENTDQQTSAFSLLGDNVTLTASDGSTVTGTVSSISSQSGQVLLTVNGTGYPLSSVVSVSK